MPARAGRDVGPANAKAANVNVAASMPESDRATTHGASDTVETALEHNRDTLKALFPLPELPALPALLASPEPRNSEAAANPARARRRAPGAAATGAALAGLAVEIGRASCRERVLMPV